MTAPSEALGLNSIISDKSLARFNDISARAQRGYNPESGAPYLDHDQRRAKLKQISDCGFVKLQEIKIDPDSAYTGVLKATMKVNAEKHGNPHPSGKVMHGGAIAGFIDTVLAGCAESIRQDPNETVVTSNLNIDFLKPALVGDELTAVAVVERLGKQTVHVKVEVYKNIDQRLNDQMRLVATATGNCTRIHPEEKQAPELRITDIEDFKSKLSGAISSVLKSVAS